MSCIPTVEEIKIRKQNLQPIFNKIKVSLLEKEIADCNTKLFYDFKVEQAKEITRSAIRIFSENLPVAFSGGKDSLVVLHIALEANPKIPIIYNNTTVEFPESLEYVRQLQEKWSLNLHITHCQKPFFRAVKDGGWATHENRWCCRPYKDQPASLFLNSRGFEAEITGLTRTESIFRRSLSPFKTPKKEPKIIRVNPIYDWNEWEVWRYIRENDLPYNPLYDMGYRRIGCWCCPLNGPTHYKRLKKTHPKLFSFLTSFEPNHPVASKLPLSTQTPRT
jgi:phosphoadenosine phosphosulfate reductase